MTYQEIADLSRDPEFAARVAAVVVEQAKTRDDFTATMVLRTPEQGAVMFLPYISTEPGFAAAYGGGGQEAITDAQLLTATQANWEAVNATWAPPE